MMVAESFWASETGLLVVLGACFAAVFVVSTFLIGSRQRVMRRRGLAARLGRGAATEGEDQTPSAQWVPQALAQAGQRVAGAAGFSGRLDQRLERAGFAMLSGEFVALTVVAALLGGAIAGIFLPNVVFILLVAATTSIAPYAWMLRGHGKRRGLLLEQLPDALTVLASSLRAGYSFLQALDTVSKEIGEPAAGEFQRVVAEIRLGRPIDEALSAMAERIDSTDLRWAVIAVNVQREVGGNMAEVLDIVANTIRERAFIRRQVQVLSADGRLSVWILSSLPFFLLLYLSIVNPDYLEPLFSRALGIAMLAGGATILALGIWFMTRIIKIDD